MIKLDCHVHTAHSHDAFQSIEHICQRIDRQGLDGAILVDHNNMDGLQEMNQVLENRYPDPKKRPLMIRGAEYSTERGHVIVIGLKTPLEVLLPFENKRFKYDDVIRQSRRQEAFIILAHPFRVQSNPPDENMLKEVDAIEVYNARSAYIRGYYRANHRAIEMAKKYNLTITAGSDAHLTHEIGKAYIEINTTREAFDIKKMKTYDISAFGFPTHPINECISQGYKALKQRQILRVFSQVLKGCFTLVQWYHPKGRTLQGMLMEKKQDDNNIMNEV
jgi:predicted metal-dependent phosphoesterase TrpH